MCQQPSTNNYQLKVCGLTKLDQIQELISLNTDFLGFIFYEKSPRFVLNHLSLEEISKINHQGKVGVFVNETVKKITEISEIAKLNFIQLHGDEDEEFILKLRKFIGENIKIIKVIRIGNQKTEELKKKLTINHQPSTIFCSTLILKLLAELDKLLIGKFSTK